MIQPRTAVEKKAKTRGRVAAGAAVASSLLVAAGAWPLALVGAGVSGWAVWRWFRYRARHGLRF